MGTLRRRGWLGMARGLAALVGVGALVGGTALVELPAQATTGFAFGRLSGPDRYATAAQIATQTFTTAGTVVMATGENFPDALSGNYLAGTADVPILLTTTNLPIPPATLSALSSLKTKNVVLLGGTNAISAAVQNQLAGTTSTASGGGSISVSRLSGTDRYGTMAAIDANAASTGGGSVGTFNGLKTAIVTTGLNFPDALSAGPMAFHEHFPIVLTDPTTLSSQASATLKNLGIQQVIIEGGTAAVSSGDESSINGMGITTLARLAGSNRSQTSQASGDFALDNLGFSHTHFNVATGDSSLGGVDALAGGPHGGTEVAPTLVTNTVSDPGFAGDFATAHCATEVNGHIFGGTSAITPTAASALTSDAASCAAGPESTASSVAAAPTTVPANGTSTSTVTVTLVANGKPVTGATVSLTAGSSTHSVISAPSGTTNAQGATFFTVSDTTPEVVTYTAHDTTNNVTLAQTATVTFTSATPAPVSGSNLTATANPASVAANGTATSTITVLVKNSAGGPVVGDTVIPTAPGGGCGTVAPAASGSDITNGQGVATFTYTAGTTAADCTVIFTDNLGNSGSVVINQGTTANQIQVTPVPATLPANGSSSSTVGVTVLSKAGAPVASDLLTATVTGGSGVCGSLASSTATTDSSGKATFVYTAGKATGTCVITVTDNSPGTGSAAITQTAGTSVSVSANPTALKADGTATSAITATVTSNQPVAGGTVDFTVTPSAGMTGACGTVNPTTDTLAGSATSPAVVTATYTAGTGTGFCTVTATFHAPAGSTAGTASGSIQINQTTTSIAPGTYAIALTASPTSIVGNGTSTSVLTATVTNASAAVPGDLVSFSTSGSNCGTVTPAVVTTNGSGVATATYTSSVGTGSCTITATEAASGSKATATVTQTGPPSLTVTANPSTVVAVLSPTSTITAVSTRSPGVPAAGDTILFTVTGASLVTGCGSVNPAAVTTDVNGVARTTYTDTVLGAIGTCTVTATDTTTHATSSTVVSQLVS